MRLVVTPAIFLAFFSLSLPSSALTLSDLRTQIRVLISDSGTATSRFRFSNAQVDDFADECQGEVIAQVYPIIKATSLELVAGTTYYGLPNTFLAVKRVTWRNRVLPERSQVNLDQTREWEAISGTPQSYFVTFASRTIIGIYPFPADSTSTGTVKVDFYAQADALSADSDVPFNGIREFFPLHYILAYCAAARMAAIDGQVNLVPIYHQIYVQGLARMASVAMARPSNIPSITPGNPPAGP